MYNLGGSAGLVVMGEVVGLNPSASAEDWMDIFHIDLL